MRAIFVRFSAGAQATKGDTAVVSPNDAVTLCQWGKSDKICEVDIFCRVNCYTAIALL